MRQSEPYLQTWWDWRAAGNFMFGGTGSGLLVFLPVILWLGLSTVSFTLAGLILMACGLGLVWAEIGRQLRFMNVFRHPHLSWMTRESYVAVLTFAFGIVLIAIAQGWIGTPDAVARSWWLLFLSFATALAAALFLYCQARILKAAKGIPVWREPRLLPFIVATGLTEGFAGAIVLTLTILVATGLRVDRTASIILLAADLALLALLIARGALWARSRAAISRTAPAKAVAVVAALDRRFRRVGIAAPSILATLHAVAALALLSRGDGAIFRALQGLADGVFLTIAALLALGSGWWIKFGLIARASYTQGFAIPKRPARGPRGSGGEGVKPGWS